MSRAGAGLRRCALLCLLPLMLAACGGPAEPVWAPREAVEAAVYRHPGPPTVTLFTVVSTSTGSGGHSALMVSGSQRVLFDPAGTFRISLAPERNDVLFGVTDRVLKVYIDYHARETYDVEIQEFQVTPAQAEHLIRAVQEYGAVPKAQCALAVSRVLRGTPGFEAIRTGYFPNRLAEQIAAYPNVRKEVVTDSDADRNHGVLIAAEDELRARSQAN